MQTIQESLEHAKNAGFHASQAKEQDRIDEEGLAYIEADLAIAKAVAGLALAILAHDAVQADEEALDRK